jgi:hypothetical protein
MSQRKSETARVGSSDKCGFLFLGCTGCAIGPIFCILFLGQMFAGTGPPQGSRIPTLERKDRHRPSSTTANSTGNHAYWHDGEVVRGESHCPCLRKLTPHLVHDLLFRPLLLGLSFQMAQLLHPVLDVPPHGEDCVSRGLWGI